MSEESTETAAQEIREQRSFAAPVVQLDEERWRAWQEKCRAHDRATARRVRLWLGMLGTASSLAGLVWWLTNR